MFFLPFDASVFGRMSLIMLKYARKHAYMWEHEPVTASELVKLCQEQLGWKRTTTYTVIKRLGEKGVLQNDNGTITSLVSKDAVQAYEIGELVEKTFEGSLPAFVAAFTKHQNISEEELDEVQRMIDRIRRGGK